MPRPSLAGTEDDGGASDTSYEHGCRVCRVVTGADFDDQLGAATPEGLVLNTPPGMTETDLDHLLSGSERFDDLPPLRGPNGGLLMIQADLTDDQQGDDEGITASFLGRQVEPGQAPTCTAELCDTPCWRQVHFGSSRCGLRVCLNCDDARAFSSRALTENVAQEPPDAASDTLSDHLKERTAV